MSFLENLLDTLRAEWDRWGNSVIGVHQGHVDDEKQFARYVRDVYCFETIEYKPKWEAIANDEFFWSAVFVSWIMRQSGLTDNDFPFSENHHTYIREFVRRRHSGVSNSAYVAYRINEVPLSAGDIVGAVRRDGISHAEAQQYYDAGGGYPAHCDIVVAVRGGEVDVVGGNVEDSVTRATLRTDAEGYLMDKARKWFVVCKLQYDGS